MSNIPVKSQPAVKDVASLQIAIAAMMVRKSEERTKSVTYVSEAREHETVNPVYGSGREDGLADFPTRLRALIKWSGQKSDRSFARATGIGTSSLQNYLDGQQVPGLDKAVRIAATTGVSIGWLATGEVETDRDIDISVAMLEAELDDLGPDIPTAGRERVIGHLDAIRRIQRDRARIREMQESGFITTVVDLEAEGKAESLLPSGFRLIPRLDVQAAAGPGAVVEYENHQEMVAFRADWLRLHGINPMFAHVLTARGDSMEPTIRDGDILVVDTSIDRVIDDAIYVVVFDGRTLVKRVQLRRDGSVVLKSDNSSIFDDEAVPAAEVPSLNIAGRVKWYGRSI